MNWIKFLKQIRLSLLLICCLSFAGHTFSQGIIYKNELSSGTKVKDFPFDTPFVFNNIVKIINPLPKDERIRLLENLQDYWADSLVANREQRFVISYRMRRPAIFDSNLIAVTKTYMRSYLFTQGYFNSTFTDTSFLIQITKKGIQQQRQNIGIFVNTGKQTIIDSSVYSLVTAAYPNMENIRLQQLADANRNESLITPKKTAWSKDLMALELDRLTAMYRNNGHYYFKRENLIAEIDTTELLLLDLTVDPFEQAVKIAEAAARRAERPSCIVNFTQRRFVDTSLRLSDTSFLKQYFVGNLTFFADVDNDGIPENVDSLAHFAGKHFDVYQKNNLFKPKIFQYYTYLKKGLLYNDKNYYKIINTLGQIGAWEQVEVRPRVNQDTLDFDYYLYPETQYKFTGNLEASRNTGDFLSSSNLIGISLNLTYRNRNVWRRAVQSSTSFRTGVEFSFDKASTLIQSTQVSLNKTFSIPHLAGFFEKKNNKDNINLGRTIININLGYSDRINFFLLRSAVGNFGWEWRTDWLKKPKPVVTTTFRIVNIELYNLDTLQGLKDAFAENPLLRNSFNTGYVVSSQANFNINFHSKSPFISHYLRISTEITNPIGRLQVLENELYEFVKAEADYRWLRSVKNRAIAARIFLGAGYNYGNDPRFGKTLPFFKQFIAGGPNSMRAWPLRQLGLGSSLLSDTSSSIFRDRYGDFQFETNLEYRFQMAHFSAVNINGAFFTDIGNIWNLRTDLQNPQSLFDFKNLYSDLAVAFGTGLRLDFNFFIIRFDLGFKLKDPARPNNKGWASIEDALSLRNWDYANTDSQPRYNYALQLGIGMPF